MKTPVARIGMAALSRLLVTALPAGASDGSGEPRVVGSDGEPWQLARAKILTCDAENVGPDDVRRSGDQPFPPGFRRGKGTVVMLFLVQGGVGGPAASDMPTLDLDLPVPGSGSRATGIGSCLSRLLEPWRRLEYGEVRDARIRCEVGDEGRVAVVEFSEPVRVRCGAEYAVSVRGRVEVRDPHPGFREYRALGACASNGDRRRLAESLGAERLVEIAKEKGAFPVYRRQACLALAEVGGPDVAACLTEVAEGARGRMLDVAIEACLVFQGRHERSGVLETLAGTVGERPFEDCVKIGRALSKGGRPALAIRKLVEAGDERKVALGCLLVLQADLGAEERVRVLGAIRGFERPGDELCAELWQAARRHLTGESR